MHISLINSSLLNSFKFLSLVSWINSLLFFVIIGVISNLEHLVGSNLLSGWIQVETKVLLGVQLRAFVFHHLVFSLAGNNFTRYVRESSSIHILSSWNDPDLTFWLIFIRLISHNFVKIVMKLVTFQADWGLLTSLKAL